MGTAVIEIDTNIVYHHPMLDSGVWTELISKSDEWDVQFAVPVVVVREAVRVVGRKWQKIRGAVAKQALAEMGLAESHQSMLEDIDAKIARFPNDLSLDEQVEFSLTLSRNRRVTKAIAAIDDDAFTPVHYPGAVEDPETGALISDAEVAETPYTQSVRGHGRVTARLVVRRVRDARYPDVLFPVWRYHPFFTNSELPTAEADLTHRRHAIVETTFADLIDGPLAHLPSGLFAANCAWLACAVITHNLLRAAGTIAGGEHAVARGATLRRDLVTVPARFAAPGTQADVAPARALALADRVETLWDNITGYRPAIPRAG